MRYNPPTGATGANDDYVGYDQTLGRDGSKIPPTVPMLVQREIVNVIAASGQAPTNTDPAQMLRAIRSGLLAFNLDVGAAGTMAIAPSPSHTVLLDGLSFRVLAGSDCAGDTTLTVNGNLTAPIRRRAGRRLAKRAWVAGDIIDVVYRAATSPYFQILSAEGFAGSLNRVANPVTSPYAVQIADAGTLFYGRPVLATQTVFQLPAPGDFGIGYLGFQNNYDDQSSLVVQATSGVITFPGRGAATTSLTLAAYKSYLRLFCDGANWIVDGASTDLALAPLSAVFAPSTASYTLTNRDNGTLFYGRAVAAATTTYVLPNPASFGPGYLGFQNNYDANSSLVINASAGAIVAPGAPNGLTTLTMAAFKSFLLLFCDGANWIVVSSTPDLFGGALAKSLGATGYVKRFDGVIEQWGTVPNIAAGSATVITFPIAFPTACDFACANPSDAGASGTYRYNVGGQNTGGMTVVNSSSGAVAGGFWYARGR